MRGFTVVGLLMGFSLMMVADAALAWGTKGHRIIGMLAQDRLTATAETQVTALLEGSDLATAATWADEMRSSQDNAAFWSDYAATWHYVNIPAGSDYLSSPKDPHGDALLAIATFSAILLEEPLPPGGVEDGLKLYFGNFDPRAIEVKRFALKFLVHILGDLQQPLHSGYAEDRGGNSVQLEWQGKSTNLHSLWDTRLLQYNDVDEATYARRLRLRIERIPASEVRNYERADVEVWLQESTRNLERMYAQLPGPALSDNDYAARFVPTVELQLVKGGLRTAWFLNGIFGGFPMGTP
ncbi:MAG: S1/P1 nuclease [Pseudomonadota bacterium]